MPFREGDSIGDVDYLRKYCPFLSGSEKDAVLGGNVAHLFGLKT
jgi:hypothetical protein